MFPPMTARARDILHFVTTEDLQEVEVVMEAASLLMNQRRASQPARRSRPQPEPVPPEAGHETTIRDRIVRVLTERGELMGPDALTAAINDRYDSDHARGSVNSELSRSVKDGVIVRPKFGHYGLPEKEETEEEETPEKTSDPAPQRGNRV